MITILKKCGDLLRYLAGPRDWKGKRREADAVSLRGAARLGAALLEALASFRLHDKLRRAWFYSRHCQHVVMAFSESRAVVDSVVHIVVPDLERLVCVGLPEDSLYWVWYYHPQQKGGHPHGGLVKTILPYGGSYDPEFRLPETRQLLELFDHLHNRKHGLSDAMEPGRARMVRPGRGSFKPEFTAAFANIELAAEDCWKRGHLEFTEDFLQLLPALGIKPLALVDNEARPRPFPAGYELGLPNVKTYRGSLTVLTPEGKQMVLRGPVLQPGFARFWQEELDRRRAFMKDLHRHPENYVQPFCALLANRAQRQRARYPKAGRLPHEITAADLDCVDQPPPKTIILSPGHDL